MCWASRKCRYQRRLSTTLYETALKGCKQKLKENEDRKRNVDDREIKVAYVKFELADVVKYLYIMEKVTLLFIPKRLGYQKEG